MKKFFATLLLIITLGVLPGETFAARVYSTGAEFQNTASGVEWTTLVSTPAISTSVKNGGSASLHLDVTTAATTEGFTHTVATMDTYYLRYYVYVDTLDTSDFVRVGLKNGANYIGSIKLRDSGGTLDMLVEGNDGTGAITDTASIVYDTWYRIEVFANAADAAGQDDLIVRVDGTDVVNVGNLTLTTGGVTVDTSLFNNNNTNPATAYVDDIALNDTTGSAQTSWSGAGKIVAARPNAAGFTACGNAGATFSAINETPSSDAVTGTTDRCDIQANGGGTVTHNVTDSSTLGIDSYDTINLVYTMHRMRELSSGATNWAPVLSYNGTATTTGTSLDTGDTTVRTNPSGTTAFGSGIVSYTNLATSLAWTPTGTNSIDSMKLGFTSTDANPDIWNATAAAMVEYVDQVQYPYVPLGPLYFNTGKLILATGKLILQ